MASTRGIHDAIRTLAGRINRNPADAIDKMAAGWLTAFEHVDDAVLMAAVRKWGHPRLPTVLEMEQLLGPRSSRAEEACEGCGQTGMREVIRHAFGPSVDFVCQSVTAACSCKLGRSFQASRGQPDYRDIVDRWQRDMGTLDGVVIAAPDIEPMHRRPRATWRTHDDVSAEGMERVRAFLAGDTDTAAKTWWAPRRAAS